jgi:ABC-2 type transport system permease protein
MFYNVYLKNLKDMRNNLIYWFVGLITLSFYLSFAYSSFAQNIGAFDELINSFPEELLHFLGASDGLDMSTFGGFLNLEIFGVIGPIMLVVVGINTGTNIVAGELNNKTLELVMSTPIGKNNYLFQQILVMITRIILISLFIWFSFNLFGRIFNLELDLKNFSATIVHLSLLGLFFGCLSLFIGSLTGNKSKTLGISTTIAIISHFTNSISPLINSVEKLKYISIFHYYKTSEPIINGIDISDGFITSALCIILIALSFFSYKYLDLN